MSVIASQLGEIQQRVYQACRRAGRSFTDVRLIAVSKTFPVEDIREAIEAGQTCFGESRLQEVEPKIAALPLILEWHFIGSVQRNKVRKILPLFPWIHAVDSLKLATYINGVAGEIGLVPKIFLQVNQAGEESKGGFTETGLADAMGALLELSHIEIAGLMTIPPASQDEQETRLWFRKLRVLRNSLEARFSTKLPFLSMGMSGDFETAVEEGATHVRVGSAIFGKRSYKVEGELG
jgi:hypothetical protein